MNYISLKNPSYSVSFKQAVLMGQAPERGLFYPAEIPAHAPDFLRDFKSYSRQELAFKVLKPFVQPCLNDKALMEIVERAVDFDFPLKQVEERVFTLELFHGPTMAFKDVGARFMSGCLQRFATSHRRLTVLVATSGDTGGAVADAFFGVEGVNVVILYPKGRVSDLQELQLTTYGGNVRAVAVEGSFDDCQALVKQAFSCEALSDRLGLTSANSINVARWLSQQVYYYFALQQWPLDVAPVISVPSGNFGNICAGIMAFKRGLPVRHFVAACNENDVFAEYLALGDFRPRPAVATVSNAMDVGNPSNFFRVMELFGGKADELRKIVSAFSYSSSVTCSAISDVFEKTGYVMDPHGAVGYLALKEYLSANETEAGIFLETAHPAKFDDVVGPLVGDNLQVPPVMEELAAKRQESVTIAPEFEQLERVLIAIDT